MQRDRLSVQLRDAPTLPESSFPTPGLTATAPAVKPSSVPSDLFGSRVREIMTRKVFTVQPTDKLGVAATLLREKGITGLPVVDPEGKVVGVLSEKDILRQLKSKAGLKMPGGLFDLVLETSEGRQRDVLTRCREVLVSLTVGAAMSAPARTVHPDTPSLDAAQEMLLRRINRLPVVEHGKLVGIVTRADVLTLYHGT